MHAHFKALDQLFTKRDFRQQGPIIMGILNITPDSFSDGGEFLKPEQAVDHARSMLREGADIIDIGGESTGPGTKPISAAEELSRIETIVQILAPEMPLSIDTYHASTAKRCLELGAVIINDVSALRADKAMAEVIAKSNAYLVMMHSKELDHTPHASEREIEFDSIVNHVSEFFKERIKYAELCNIKPEQIILDPGMGRFLSKRPEVSWELLAKLDQLCQTFSTYKILVGTSRKGFLGGEITERDPLSQLTGLAAWIKGASILRTHNVRMCREFIESWLKILS